MRLTIGYIKPHKACAFVKQHWNHDIRKQVIHIMQFVPEIHNNM